MRLDGGAHAEDRDVAATRSEPITRRDFCGRVAAVSVSVLLAAVAGASIGGGCATAPVFRGTANGDRLVVPRSQFASSGAARQVVVVEATSWHEPILLVRHGAADEFTALSGVCTHQGCHVSPSGPALVCPCHGSMYDDLGNVTRSPATMRLARYQVLVTADSVVIDLGSRS